ncbi:hypothetical protein ACYUFO_003516 [Vibrio parahaemolyticus]
MSTNLVLMGITVDDFTWYEVGDVGAFVDRNLPQIVNELAAEGVPLTVVTVNQTEAPEYEEMQVALIFENLFLPVYENGDFYIKPNGKYATRKRSDGYALLGIRNES